MGKMLVWQCIAKGTKMNSMQVVNWLNKYDIRACELEEKVTYTGEKIKCKNDCDKCLKDYLNKETGKEGFNEVIDEFGEIQLRLW